MDDRVIGAVAAGAFAVFMGLQALIISHHLKAESMITVNVYSFAILSGVSWPGLIWGGGKSIADGWSNPVTLSPYLLMSVGVLFLLSFYLRSTAFQLAEGSSTSVAILIYVRASRTTPRITGFRVTTTLVFVTVHRPNPFSLLFGNSSSSATRSRATGLSQAYS